MNIYKKLFQLQQTYNSTKDNFNAFGKYSFRNVEQILAELKPILQPLNLVIVFNEEIVNGNNNDYIKFEAKLIDVETDESVSNVSVCGIDTELKGMSQAQMTGACLTYGRKYCLGGLLGFSTGIADPDSMDNTKLNNKTQNKSMTTAEKVSSILEQISECNTINELTALWNKIGNWSKNESIRASFTAKKETLKNI